MINFALPVLLFASAQASVASCSTAPRLSQAAAVARATYEAKRQGARPDQLLVYEANYRCTKGRPIWLITLGHKASHFGVDYVFGVGDRDNQIEQVPSADGA